MARKHEHFGLRYLEELNILKERENICKESRREFLRFKRETTRGLSKPLLEVTAPEQSPQIASSSCQSSGTQFPFTKSSPFPFELDSPKIKKKVRIFPNAIDAQKQSEDVNTQQKLLHKKDASVEKKQSHGSRKANVECRSDNLEYEGEKVPVVIASLVGTSKQLTISNRPEPPPKTKYQKAVRGKSQAKSPVFLQDSTNIKELDQKILPEHTRRIIAVPSTFSAEMDDLHSVISSSSEKSFKSTKEYSKPSQQNSLIDFEKAHSIKSSASSSAKSISESMEEILTRSKSGTSKVHMKRFPRSKSQMQASVHKLPSGTSQRSIDEIIASLKSTAPTASDLRIKELLESILGQDYSIKTELPAIKKETQSSELATDVTAAGMEQVKPPSPFGTELGASEDESPAEAVTEQVTPADAEQTKLEWYNQKEKSHLPINGSCRPLFQSLSNTRGKNSE